MLLFGIISPQFNVKVLYDKVSAARVKTLYIVHGIL